MCLFRDITKLAEDVCTSIHNHPHLKNERSSCYVFLIVVPRKKKKKCVECIDCMDNKLYIRRVGKVGNKMMVQK
jgi:hypothetical protein